jgi:hypothetical protein
VSTVEHRFTGRPDGDLAVTGEHAALAARRAAIGPGPWTWLRQVHGADVVVVTEPGEHAGAAADAAVTAVAGAVLAVQTADCAPLLLVGDGGVGVVHAGWRGLVAGVVEAAAGALASLGAPPQRAVLGPCIRPRCYEFAGVELDQVAERYGSEVRARTSWGTPALDLAAGVAAACRGLGVELDDAGTCTACSPVHWSHRARTDPQRQALVAWLTP